MFFQLNHRRMLLLTEGQLGIFSSKTAVSVLRYRPDDVVGILDSACAGQALGAIVPGVKEVPIVARVADAASLKPDAILIGVAPAGGALPPVMRQHVFDGLRQGLAIVSGLHTLLKDDPELVGLAREHNAELHDLRDFAHITRIGMGLARQTRAKRVLVVGTDCNCGKMVTALELRRSAVRAGLDAAFVATGQTGIMIEGWGIAIDHVLSDFVSGAVEMLVEHAALDTPATRSIGPSAREPGSPGESRVADRPIMFIEGQGSISHPAYSGVTLGLVHGACPDAMVICHRPDRTHHNGWADCPVAPIEQQIAMYEQLLAPLHPGKIVAVAVNTASMDPAAAADAVRDLARRTNLPAADPIRDGCDTLLVAVRAGVGV
ncbi:MAG: DUF1611 domain-containing protein [Planctomycetes bacterium]|nr:DUF1611 domain-containing protein [Planctomycetota bacterium]